MPLTPRRPERPPVRRLLQRLAAAIALAALMLGAAAACTREGGADRPPANPDPAQNSYAPALGVVLQAFQKMPNGIYYLDLDQGNGAPAAAGQRVTVHYTGWLPDGTKFDSSKDRNEPFPFILGAGEVIRGWDEGVVGMRVGGRRKLVIPADLGYGAAGAPPDIPPNSVLVFEVQVLGIQ